MSNNTPINLRIKFKKIGNLQYISHLDLVRTMNKIVTRANLPLWYTEGFNPKPKMVFAAPLSIGTESICEYMDLRLSEKIDPQIAIDSLNKNLTDELVVLDAYYPEGKLTELKWLAYTVTVDTVGASSELAAACTEALAKDSIKVNKKEALGGAEMDIAHLIKSAVAEYRDGKIYIECLLSADASAFLNPEYVVKYLKGAVGILSSGNLLAEGYSIFRHSAYRGDMTTFA